VRPDVQLGIQPEHLNSIEQLECVKMFDVFIDSELLFSEHVAHILTEYNQILYLLNQPKKQSLSDKCIAIVYDAIVLSKVLYALSGWGGYISQVCADV